MHHHDSEQEIEIESLDHLGLVAGMIDQLRLVEKIDQILGSSSAHNKVLSHGELVKLMILNGLGFSSQALYLYSEYFKGKPLHLLMHREIHESQINDDVLGRTLDALFEGNVSKIFEALAQSVIEKLGIRVRSLHMDTTSFHVDGAYAQTEGKEHVQLKHGYSRDGHPELNQVILQLITTAEGNLPLFMRALDGNRNDQSSFAESVRTHVEGVRQAVENRYTVGDAALYTPEAIQAFHQGHHFFVTRVPSSLGGAKKLLQETSLQTMEEIGEGYSAFECEVTHHGCPQRWIVVHSQKAEKRNQTKGLHRWKKLCQKSETSWRRLKKKSFCCREDAQQSLEEYERCDSLIDLSEVLIEEAKHYTKGGRPTADTPYKSTYRIQGEWTLKADAYDIWMRHQGHFILATNDLDREAFSASEVLKMYKAQQSVEGGFRFLKSPDFFTSAFFLKNPERIESLLMVMTLCLLVYGALEHQMRQGLQEKQLDFIDQKKRATRKPTARWVFFCFRDLTIIHSHGKRGKYRIVNLHSHHRILLEALGESYQSLYQEGWRVCKSRTIKHN